MNYDHWSASVVANMAITNMAIQSVSWGGVLLWWNHFTHLFQVTKQTFQTDTRVQEARRVPPHGEWWILTMWNDCFVFLTSSKNAVVRIALLVLIQEVSGSNPDMVYPGCKFTWFFWVLPWKFLDSSTKEATNSSSHIKIQTRLSFIRRHVVSNTNTIFNPLTPNDLYMSRTAPLTSKRCIL